MKAFVLMMGIMLLWIHQVWGQPDLKPGQFIMYTVEGETFMDGTLEMIDITATRPNARQMRRGRKKLAKITRLRWNVHKVYPYAIKVAYLLEELQDTLDQIADHKVKKEFIKRKEKSLFGEYENDLRRMSRSQGKVLVKLVYRETGRDTFALIKDYKSGASAVFWQSIGLLFGINLKSDYNPEEESLIEQMVQDLENGGYNIAYKRYGFTLD